MEYTSEKLYEVEKIINCKYFNNKKYYLIKWLCYPINQSTWESKENLKHLKYLIDEFEAEYPYTIDKCMYNIFCNEVKIKKKIKKKENIEKNINPHIKFLSKKRNNESFNENELNDPYLDRLKMHLHIKVDKNNKNNTVNIKEKEDSFFIDLRGNDKENEIKLDNSFGKETNENFFKENKKTIPKLIKPNVV